MLFAFLSMDIEFTCSDIERLLQNDIYARENNSYEQFYLTLGNLQMFFPMTSI